MNQVFQQSYDKKMPKSTSWSHHSNSVIQLVNHNFIIINYPLSAVCDNFYPTKYFLWIQISSLTWFMWIWNYMNTFLVISQFHRVTVSLNLRALAQTGLNNSTIGTPSQKSTEIKIFKLPFENVLILSVFDFNRQSIPNITASGTKTIFLKIRFEFGNTEWFWNVRASSVVRISIEIFER